MPITLSSEGQGQGYVHLRIFGTPTLYSEVQAIQSTKKLYSCLFNQKPINLSDGLKFIII